MSARTAARLAWSLWASTLALVAGGLVLGVAGGPQARFYTFWVEDALIGPTFATLGALIVSRRPGNVIGWIFLACGAGAGVQLLSGQYATTALHAQTAPGGAVAAWLSNLAQFSIVFSVLFLVMLFPTGRMPSPRWRPLAWISAAVAAVLMACTALAPGPIESFPSAQNPFGVGSLTGVSMALVEAQLVLATVLGRCRLRPVSDSPVEAEALATLRPQGGLPMIVEAT